MTSSSAIHVSAGDRQVAIPHDKLRLIVRFRARLPEVDAVQKRPKVRAAIGRPEERGCSQERAL
jgi:hypothetical protein